MMQLQQAPFSLSAANPGLFLTVCMMGMSQSLLSFDACPCGFAGVLYQEAEDWRIIVTNKCLRPGMIDVDWELEIWRWSGKLSRPCHHLFDRSFPAPASDCAHHNLELGGADRFAAASAPSTTPIGRISPTTTHHPAEEGGGCTYQLLPHWTWLCCICTSLLGAITYIFKMVIPFQYHVVPCYTIHISSYHRTILAIPTFITTLHWIWLCCINTS